jgi:UDP-N-acetylglucosamine 2-epimerase (non-hydrolysing)
LTLRPNTERPITIEVGTNKLTTLDRLSADIEDILNGRRSSGQIPQYWDGQTAERVLDALLEKS